MEYSEEGQGGQGLVLPETELLDPAAHTAQSAGPGAVLYVPDSHCVQADEFGPAPVVPASHPSWKVSTAALEGSPVPVTARRVTQSEESLRVEGEAALLPWSLKSSGRRVGQQDWDVMEKLEIMTSCGNDI